MRKRSSLVLAVLAVSGISAVAGPATAGEVKGPTGGSTPIRDVAASACAFSGYNDFQQGQSDFHVQSYGIYVSGHTTEPAFGHPGTGDPYNCRGN